MDATAVVGRTAAAAQLCAAIRSSRSGATNIVSITGATGGGKTTMLDVVGGEVVPGDLVLRAAGHQEEKDLPYAGLHQLLGPIAESLDGTLRGALTLAPARPIEHMTVAAALFRLLSTLAADRFVLVLLDDVQWLDTASRQALTFCARRLDEHPVMMVFAGSSTSELMIPATTIVLQPIDRDSAAAILRGRHPMVHTTVERRIIDAAAGLPRALVDIAAALSEDQRRGIAPLPDVLPIGPALERFYAPRLDQLGERAWQALVLAALEPGGGGALAGSLGAAGLTGEDLAGPERHDLIRLIDGRWTFSHPLLRSAVLIRADSCLVRACHRILAERSQGARRAWHLHRGSSLPDETVATALIAAAEQAQSRRAFIEAAEYWLSARMHALDDSRRYRVTEQAVECLLDVGMATQAGALIDELIESAPDDVARLHWEGQRLGLALWQATPGTIDPTELVSRAAGYIGGPASATAEEVLVTVAIACAARGDQTPAGLLDLLRDHGQRRSQSVVLVAESLDGSAEAAATLAGDWIEDLLVPETLGEAAGIIIAGYTLLWLDRITACRRLVERLEAFDLPPLSGLRAVCHQLSALCSLRNGDWVGADRHLGVAARIAAEGGLAMVEASNRLHRAQVAVCRGEEVLAAQLLDDSERDAPVGAPWARFGILLVRARLHELRGEFVEAASAYASAEEVELQRRFAAPSLNERLNDHVTVLVRLGRHDEARAVIDRYERFASVYRAPTARGATALGRGQIDGDANAFDRALTHSRAAANCFEQARCRLERGEFLRRRRRRNAAVEELARAEAMFASLGAAPWETRTRAELAACGVRRVAEPSDLALAGLTPREYEVARTVAAGVTNAEAARVLFISPRTVGYHLASTYRKLGIGGRDELKRFF